MGYDVKSLRFYSSDDNKVYPVPLQEDDVEMFEKFKGINREMQSFTMDNLSPKMKKNVSNVFTMIFVIDL
jgi:hypothetical protein